MSATIGSFADRRRGSRHERGYGSAWDRLRKVVLARDGGMCRCAECRRLGRVLPATEVDHIVPKHLGGTDDETNLQAINRECHAAKTALEAMAARGLTAAPRPSARCSAAGLPTDPRHPWAQGKGGLKTPPTNPAGPIPHRRLQDAEMEGGGFGG